MIKEQQGILGDDAFIRMETRTDPGISGGVVSHLYGSANILATFSDDDIVMTVLEDHRFCRYAAKTSPKMLCHDMGCCEHAGLQQSMRVVEGHADLHRSAVGVEHVIDLVHTPDKLPALVSNGSDDDGISRVDLTDVALVDIGNDPNPP